MVVQGAECDTDHQMLRMKLEVLVKGGSHKPQKGQSGMGIFDVTMLCGPNVTVQAKTLCKSAKIFVELRADFPSPIVILHLLQISCG